MTRRLAGALIATALLTGCTSQAGPSMVSASPTSASSPRSTVVPAQSATPAITPAPTSTSSPVGTWKKTGSLHTARADSTATLLPDGKVLVTGGVDSFDDRTWKALASAELYDPATGRWRAAANMHYPRSGHSATLLADGRVLVAGGTCVALLQPGCPSTIDPSGAIAAAEVYDPKSGTWTDTGSMLSERSLHSATRLADGRVLVVGAELAPDEVVGSTELYDPATGRWTATGDMLTPRWQHFAVGLPYGGALVAGGFGPITLTDRLLNSVEIYDPRTGAWHTGPALLTARAQGGAAVLLADDRILIAGGNGEGDRPLASAELYDPADGSRATVAMSTARAESASVVLRDGRVLAVGGFDVPDTTRILTSAELFDPIAGTWVQAGAMGVARFDFRATLLDDGRVLVAGGMVDGVVTASAELYDAAP